MKQLPMLSLLACLVLASCGGDASDPAPAPHELALASAVPGGSATAQPATLATQATQTATQVSTHALARAPAQLATNGTLRICRTLPGTKVPLCRSGRWPARFGPVIQSLALAPVAAPGKPAPSLRSDPGTDDPPPSGPPSGGTPPGPRKAIPLALLFEADGHAEVCAFTGAAFRCARVAATVPLGVTVGAWSLPGGYEALTYTRAPGVHGIPDPKGQAALRFQAAFDIAVKAVRSAVGTSANANGNAGARLRTGPGTSANLEDWDPGDDGGDWGGGGGDWGWGDSGGTGAGDVPVDPVPAPAPDPGNIDAIPVVIITGHADTIDSEVTELPPRDMNDDLGALSDPCLISPIITVCIRGQRPPPPPDDVPDPPRPTPWFPQSWCDWSPVLCSAGQQPAPPLTEAERRARERQECFDKANAHATYCRDVQGLIGDAGLQELHQGRDRRGQGLRHPVPTAVTGNPYCSRQAEHLAAAASLVGGHMRFSGNYLTFGVGAEQDDLVLQTYLSTGDLMPGATFGLAEINAWNAGQAAHYVGMMVLAAVSVMSPAMQRHPYHHLLRENVERLPSTVRYGAAPVRPVRLRAILAPEPDRLLIQRCSNPVVADATLQELLLARLVLSGPAASVRTVGTKVLSELEAMHPDVFSRYPSLLGANAPRCHE